MLGCASGIHGAFYGVDQGSYRLQSKASLVDCSNCWSGLAVISAKPLQIFKLSSSGWKTCLALKKPYQIYFSCPQPGTYNSKAALVPMLSDNVLVKRFLPAQLSSCCPRPRCPNRTQQVSHSGFSGKRCKIQLPFLAQVFSAFSVNIATLLF